MTTSHDWGLPDVDYSQGGSGPQSKAHYLMAHVRREYSRSSMAEISDVISGAQLVSTWETPLFIWKSEDVCNLNQCYDHRILHRVDDTGCYNPYAMFRSHLVRCYLV